MKTRMCLSILLLVVFLLAACSPATITPAPTEAAATPGGNGPDTSASTQEVYPDPQEEQQAPSEPQPEVLYPGPADGDEVNWTQAIAMIMNGEVKQVTQAHSLQVTLMLKDGRSLITFEPAIDEVTRILAQCGEPCSDITFATE